MADRYVWKTSLNRKKRQRGFNRAVRELNRVIENDNLWCGRFYVRQKRSSFYIYDDRSGGELDVEIEFVDRQTGKTMTKYECDNAILFGGKLYLWMNYFIVEWCDVWHETPGPYEAKKLREEANNDSSQKRSI